MHGAARTVIPKGMSASVIPVRESAAISGPKDPRVIVGDEAVAAAGYNPAVFHAIVPSEAMRGGRVNKNGRIYGSVEAVCAHHLALVNRAREGYIGGEKGHPLDTDNPTHPTDAIKIAKNSTHRLAPTGRLPARISASITSGSS